MLRHTEVFLICTIKKNIYIYIYTYILYVYFRVDSYFRAPLNIHMFLQSWNPKNVTAPAATAHREEFETNANGSKLAFGVTVVIAITTILSTPLHRASIP